MLLIFIPVNQKTRNINQLDFWYLLFGKSHELVTGIVGPLAITNDGAVMMQITF